MTFNFSRLEGYVRDAAEGNTRYALPERAAYLSDAEAVAALPTEAELETLLTETIHNEIDTALIYDARIRSLWEELGEPEPECLAEHDSISAAILAAVTETLLADDGGYLRDAANEGSYNAIMNWADDSGISVGEYSGTSAIELVQAIQGELEV